MKKKQLSLKVILNKLQFSTLKSVECYEGSYCVDDKFTKPIVVFRGENTADKFIEAILKEYWYCKKVMEKYFNKNSIMSEEEQRFQSSRTCGICEKLIDDDDEKIRDHCHINWKI